MTPRQERAGRQAREHKATDSFDLSPAYLQRDISDLNRCDLATANANLAAIAACSS